MIQNIVAEIANQFKLYQSIGFYQYKSALNEERETDRVVWFPTSDTYESTWNIGRNANEVFSRNINIDFHIYSRDLNKIDNYINDLLISAYDKVHGPQITDVSGTYLDQGQNLQQGFCYVLSLEISGIVIKRPLRTVEIETVEPQTHIVGSTTFIPPD